MLIMGTEMAGGLQLFLPLLLAIPVAFFVSGVRESIYNEQVLNRLHSPAHIFEYRDDLVKSIKVKDAMKKDYLEVHRATELSEVLFQLKLKRLTGAVVVDEGRFEGYLSRNAIHMAGGYSGKRVSEIELEQPILFGEGQSIGDAINILPKDSEENIIVQDAGGNVVGTLGFGEIANAYEKYYRKAKFEQMVSG